jgi:hypothetical protein
VGLDVPLSGLLPSLHIVFNNGEERMDYGQRRRRESLASLRGERASSLRRKCPVSKPNCPIVTGIVTPTHTGPILDLSKR